MEQKWTPEKIIKVCTERNIFPTADFYSVPEGEYVPVLCPFHFDTNPSAGFKVTGYFNCLVAGCEKDINWFTFLTRLRELDRKTQANRYNIPNDFDELLKDKEIVNQIGLDTFGLLHNPALASYREKIYSYKITDNVMEDLGVGFTNNKELFCVPVWFGHDLIGKKFYNPNGSPKSWSTKGLKNGYVIPFNQWKENKTPTLLVAGEKDMLVARSQGYNAITLTGGEGTLPNTYVKEYFRDREVVIAYDNDDAGRSGAETVSETLLTLGCKVKILKEHFHNYLPEKGDITDWFQTYSKDQLDYAIANTFYESNENIVIEEPAEKQEKVHLFEAQSHSNINHKLVSSVQIVTEEFAPSSIPGAYKFSMAWHNEIGEQIWYHKLFVLTENNMDLCLAYSQTRDKVKTFEKGELFHKHARWIHDEDFLAIKRMDPKDLPIRLLEIYNNNEFTRGPDGIKPKDLKTVHVEEIPTMNKTLSKYQVVAYRNSEASLKELAKLDAINESLELTLYSFQALQANSTLDITYRPVANSFNKFEIVLMLLDVEKTTNSVGQYEVNSNTAGLLSVFQPPEGTPIDIKMRELYKRYVAGKDAYASFELFFLNELTFHSVLNFKYARSKGATPNVYRGTLYSCVIGDTRVGKSETAQNLVQMYQQGKFINAKSATVKGITGGSDKVDGRNVIRAGELPRNDKGLVVLEEIHGIDGDYYKETTELKSSSILKIVRVSGATSYNCRIRLIEIANPGGKDSRSMNDKVVGAYPNGLALIRSLISRPEDIARNDLYWAAAAPTEEETLKFETWRTNVVAQGYTLLNEKCYQERIKWVWSREADEIVFEDTDYLSAQAKQLGHTFNGGIDILGREANLKLARMSIALAGVLASTNDNFQSIYVTNKHIDYVVEIVTRMYKSEYMRIDEYAQFEKSYKEFNDNDVAILQNHYSNDLTRPAISHLEVAQQVTKDTISAATGLPTSGQNSGSLSSLLNSLISHNFIRNDASKVNTYTPTEKFRHAVKKINKNISNFANTTMKEGGFNNGF